MSHGLGRGGISSGNSFFGIRWKVSLGFRPGAFHRGANVREAFHLEPIFPIRILRLFFAYADILSNGEALFRGIGINMSCFIEAECRQQAQTCCGSHT